MVKRRRQHKQIQKHVQSNTALITVSISDLSRGGAGVGRDESGRTIFVPFTVPGDVVRVRLHRVKRRYAEGELVELTEPSSLRVEPRCPVFGRCGGCEWQHVSYELQWQTKEAGVRESLRLAKVEVPQEWYGFPALQAWEYRNRIQLRGHGSTIGFYARQSNTLVPIEHCDIVPPAINAVLKDIASHGGEMKEPYKVELALAADGSVQRFWNAKHGAAGFRQVNDEQNAQLQTWINSSLTPVSGLLDLYGGNGNLSLPLVDMAQEIHCVDVNAPEQDTVSVPDIYHFHRSAVLPWMQKRLVAISQKELALEEQSWIALIDPPRGGLGDETEDIITALEGHNVRTVVLVGCKTDPWSRDVAHFVARGWRLHKVAVFDFFPQTSHVESVAILVDGKVDGKVAGKVTGKKRAKAL